MIRILEDCGEVKAMTHICKGTCDGKNPPGADRDLGAGRGRQRGGGGGCTDTGTVVNAGTLDTRRRDERRRLAGGGCGQLPGARRFAPREEVGSG